MNTSLPAPNSWMALGTFVLASQFLIAVFTQIVIKLILNGMEKKSNNKNGESNNKNGDNNVDLADIKKNITSIYEYTKNISIKATNLDARIKQQDSNIVELSNKIQSIENKIHCTETATSQGKQSEVNCLIVENDKIDAKLMELKLEKLGFNGMICNSYEEAIDYIEKYNFDIAIAPWDKKDHTGLNLWNYCKANNSQTNVVLYDKNNKETKIDHPNDLEILQKPFDFIDLKNDLDIKNINIIKKQFT